MAESFIKSFSVYGLFGKDDVHISFDENIKILIGENGIGKTQILNIFYYILTRDFVKLTELPFEKIHIVFEQDTVKIEKQRIYDCLEDNIKPFEKLEYSSFLDFSSEISRDLHYVKNKGNTTNNSNNNSKRNHITKQKDNNKKINNYINNRVEIIENNLFQENVLYFPTFRRVEEDLHNLGYDEEELFLSREDTKLIHFGMDDVQQRFNTIEKRIDSLLKEGFTKISSEILSKLVKGFEDTNKKVLDRISETDIDIILARVGDQISEAEKDKIKGIVLNKEVSNIDNSLFYFIQTLVEIYEKQKGFDDSVNKFKKICNSYLVGKQVIYDESNIKIYIRSDGSNEPLPLNKLSSGEKQIISIFSKIYLSEDEQRFIVLFDEPELSLSMPWQKKLLPDILASNKCDFLLAVTHSPFIFDNDLDRYAMGLSEYIQPQEKATV